jgi:hypothetical protein
MISAHAAQWRLAMSETNASPSTTARALPPRDARGRFVARSGAAPKSPRVASQLPRTARSRARSLPARDARGRFVAFPTTSAPSWYVFYADGYRIPGDTEVMAVPMGIRPEPQPQRLPPARIVHRRRPAMQWDEVATWLLIVVFVVVVGWRVLHLQLPHH